MKNIIILCLISLLSNSQTVTTSGGTMTIKSISPDPVCECDSIGFNLNVKIANLADPSINYYTVYLRYSEPTYQYLSIVSLSNSDLFALPKVPGQFLGDTVYTYKWKVPCNFISTYGITGPSYSTANFCLSTQNGATARSTKVLNCITGLKENYMQLEPRQYYDVYGNKTEAKTGVLLFDNEGNKFIIISE